MSRAKTAQQTTQFSLAETAVHRVPSEEDDQLCEVSSNQDEEVFSPLQAQSPAEADSFESDTGNPHPSSPSEDFSSYSQMVTRMASVLKMQRQLPSPPTVDPIFGDIDRESSQPLSLNYISQLFTLIMDACSQPATPLSVSRRTENMYRIHEDEVNFLSKHSAPNSVIVHANASCLLYTSPSPRD